jgi:heme-degrading monooxygenase HmoA
MRHLQGGHVIIVSGRIDLQPGARQKFLESSVEAVRQARNALGCHDFVVAADPIEPDRVNVYEEWESEEALLAFRGDGPDQDVSSSIVRAEVFRHVVISSGSA